MSEPSKPTPANLGELRATASSSAQLEISVQRQILHSARTLLLAGHPAAAIVAAQTASEVFMERRLADLFELHKISHLWAEVGAFISTYNIAATNKKLRRLYVALSDDHELAQQPFWTKLTDHVELRNRIVHDGVEATANEAEASYAAVDALMNHVEGVLSRTRKLLG